MHQLDRISVGQRRIGQARAADDLAVQLDNHRPRVETEMPQQVGCRGRTGETTRLTIDLDLELTHRLSTQGASRARAAAAGLSANQSARMAATP